MPEKNKIIPALLGWGVGLALLYVTVRVVSGAWKSGQK